MTGSSAQGIKTVLHPVSDLATAAWWLPSPTLTAMFSAASGPMSAGRLVARTRLRPSALATPYRWFRN